MSQTQKNRADDNCGGDVIGCQTVGVATDPATAGKEVKRMNCSKRNSRLCLVACRPWPQRIGGFTLIELLVVIAIISLLLGLLIPCLHITKEKATQCDCGIKLKGLGVVVWRYVEEHDGQFPKVTDLKQVALQVREALQPYINSEEIFCCRNDPNKPTPPGGSYDWRVTNDPKTNLSGVRLDLLRHPSRVIIAGERSPGWHKPGMINVLFADGHVDQVTIEEWFRNITTSLESL